MNTNRILKSTTFGSIISVIFVVIVTIVGDLYKVTDASGKVINPIKDLLKSLHGHHWVGKGIWAVALFCVTSFVLYFVMKDSDDSIALNKLISVLTWFIAIGTACIFGFFMFEYLA